MTKTGGLRLYNLFPLLAGPVQRWHDHLDRIKWMGFDAVFVNPFHEPGFSGSLYAVKSYERLHPALYGDDGRGQHEQISDFVAAAEARGLKVIVDLVINHTAQDADLVSWHPDWYVREEDGSIRSPRAIDPDDPRKFTVWTDLAELDFHNPAVRDAQVEFFKYVLDIYLNMGVHGFRCDAAYQVPADIWTPLLEHGRARRPGCLFLAETLGCRPEEVAELAPVGFDYLFNSAKWWDFRKPWLLDQYDRYRWIAPTIAFPESHDTPRLAAELGDLDPATRARALRFHYLYAATFSSGVMMPMGFEYGARTPLHVVTTNPDDWLKDTAEPADDLTGFISAVNAMRATVPGLSVEARQASVAGPDCPVVALLREAKGLAPVAVLINPDSDRPQRIDPSRIWSALDVAPDALIERTPGFPPSDLTPGLTVELEPLAVRLFEGVARQPSTLTEKAPPLPVTDFAEDRVAIERVSPELDGGRFPVKRSVGDVMTVEADIFADGHDKIDACVRYRRDDEGAWHEAPMTLVDNDRWAGSVPLAHVGRLTYTVEAWCDPYQSWVHEVTKKREAGVDVSLETIEGVNLARAAVEHGVGRDRAALADLVARLESFGGDQERILALLMSEAVSALMAHSGIRANLSRYHKDLVVKVDRKAARFAAWYEMFPRSQSGDPNRHGTFRDVIERLPYVRDMGFDVLYFTPIHPVGQTNKKGKNNSLISTPEDPGSVYAIGSADGGHTDLHPELGSFDDFADLIAAAHDHGLEIAIDWAIQCSPDHPWLKEHPDWFDWRPDGTIKYAENPPKKYEDIVPVHFYDKAYPDVWIALRDAVEFWVEKGVRIFRVDNPHTKPLPFWEWLIADIHHRYPDVIFLAEAFTRPKMMKRLAKIGYTQSYTYFTWRNTKHELMEYLTELTQDEPREYYRPNFFANTPDINPFILQSGNPAAFKARLVLAATLSSVYGLYNGYELCEGTPVPGKEEYLNSEKYEIKAWDWDRPGNIREMITAVNRIRRENPALQFTDNLLFLNAYDDNILCYAKMTDARDNVVMVAVNLDPDQGHGATIEVPLWEFGLPDHASIEVTDLLSGDQFTWHGKLQHIWLDPVANPCLLWRLTPPGRTD